MRDVKRTRGEDVPFVWQFWDTSAAGGDVESEGEWRDFERTNALDTEKAYLKYAHLEGADKFRCFGPCVTLRCSRPHGVCTCGLYFRDMFGAHAIIHVEMVVDHQSCVPRVFQSIYVLLVSLE